MTPTREAAHTYADHGWRVIPILPGQKRPTLENWPTAATLDHTLIDDWYTRWPDHGVGIVTGHLADGTQLVVLDIDDNGHDKRGRDTLDHLTDTYGPLPDTITVATGSGGTHHYWLVPAGHPPIKNDAGKKLGPWLDIRGEGGQVLAPPTAHPNGTPYRYEHGYAPDEIPIAQMPDWMIALLTETPPPPRTTRIPYTGGTRPGDRFASAITWPQLLTADGATHIATRRDGHELWARPGLTGTDLHTSATLYYGGTDLLKVFSSGWPGLAENETYTRFGYWAATRFGGDHPAAARELARTHTDPQLAELVANLRPGTSTPDATGPSSGDERLSAIEASLLQWGPEFWDDDHSAENWLIEPLIAAGRGHALYAPAKTGKSLLTLFAAVGAATGTGALRHPAAPPIRILYLDYEMTVSDVRERLRAFGYGPQTDLSHLHYALLPAIDPLDTATGGATIIDAATRLAAQLVIIDTTARAVQGDENSADTYRAFYRYLGRGLKAAGIAFLRLDHAGKDAERGQRGSSAKNDDVDIVMRLTKRDNGYTLRTELARVQWFPAEVEITVTEDDDDGITRIRTSGHTWPPRTAEIATAMDALGIPLDASRRALRSAAAAAGIKVRSEVLAAVARYRSTPEYATRLENSGTTSGTTLSTGGPRDSGTTGDHPTKPLVTDRDHLGDHRGPPPAGNGDHWSPRSGDQSPARSRTNTDTDDTTGLF